MKKRILLLLLLSNLMTSCKKYHQKDWHIKTYELADVYFPKYFEEIEKFLLINDITYEKDFSELLDNEINMKYYNACYTVSEKINFEFRFVFSLNHCHFNCKFNKHSSNEYDAFHSLQKYINVMIDTVNFCSHNFLGTGEMFNTWYDEVKKKYLNNEIDGIFGKYLKISAGENYRDLLPTRGIDFCFTDQEYNLEIYLVDYLTDVNIWDK